MRWVLVVAVAVLTTLAAAGSAAAEATFTGGALTRGSADSGLVRIVVRDKTAGANVRANWKCRRNFYRIGSGAHGRRSGPRVRVGGRGMVRLVGGVARYRWRLSAKLGSQGGAGSLTIRGFRVVDGRRKGCGRQRIPIRVKVESERTGPPAPARADSLYLGGQVSDSAFVDDLTGVVVKTSGRRRLRALWWVRLSCSSRLPGVNLVPERLLNLTPRTRVDRRGRFDRRERFGFRAQNARYRYTVRFSGRFTRRGARGTLDTGLDLLTLDGRRFGRCDAARRKWSAVRADATVPTASEISRTARNWTFAYGHAPSATAEGFSATFGPPSPLELAHDRNSLAFAIDGPDDYVTGRFAAPGTQALQAGRTYVDSSPAPTSNAAVLDTGTCSQATGRFTVNAAAYDLFGRPRLYDIAFEVRCNPGEPLTTGTFRVRR